jgi:hypothetical protein
MTTPTRSEELVRRMLERRADAPPPAWLLQSLAQAVQATPQTRARRGWAGSLPRRRNERLVLVAAAVMLLLAVVLGAVVAGGLVRTPKTPLPAVVVEPSPGATESSDVPSALPSGTTAPPGPGSTSAPVEVVAKPAWALPAGWRYELECDDDGGSGCGLALYDEAGRILDGWPVAVTGVCQGLAVGPEDSVFVACTRKGRVTVTGLDRGGRALPGWPVSLKGEVAYSTWYDFTFAGGSPEIAVGPDATVYVPMDPDGKASYSIHGLAPDGKERSGWPVSLAGDAQGFAVAPDGTIVAWWYEGYEEAIQLEASRTVFTEFDPNGRVRPGWPRGSKGAASGPVVGEDGSIYYVSASGKVWGQDRNGEIIEGWPYELAEPIAPSLRADGTLQFIESSRVVVLSKHGKAVSGWPYRTKGSFLAPGCDTPGFPHPLATTAVDGTLYLASWDGKRSTVVALDIDGAVADGWPYTTPAGWRVSDLYLSDGMVAGWLIGDICGEGPDGRSIRLTLQGTFVGEALPTPLSGVYDAMRLEGLRTSVGQDAFAQGARIEFDIDLVNRSADAVTLPHVVSDTGSWYAAGSLQTWIEPLGVGPPPPCLSPSGDEDGRYGAGGWIIVSADPVTIARGGAMPSLTQPVLEPEVTACLASGDYRYRVEYRRYDDEESIDVATLDFTITAVDPSQRPIPTPRRTPTPSLTPPIASTTPGPS